MLGLFLIYFIGKAYYELAHEFDKHRWGFAILGVVTYYAGFYLVAFITGILIGLGVFGDLDIDNIPEIGFSLLCLPFGILACWGLHRILKNQWSKARTETNVEALDSDMLQ